MVKTGIRLVLYGQDGKEALSSDFVDQGKGRRTVVCALKPSDLAAGRYRLVVLASNGGPGTGKVMSQAIFVNWKE